ncbi:Type III secretion bridge between inner and outermembrane lipoprotein (YscJ,HrcJ,EscJ, PscJ) [Mesorhizobium amorphae CCNWGS0123]|uniref:Lipoprotein n=7 Tax=Mesorhizobium TaxID=68287 RepID=G6YH88_9HYPH|nr:type III secretion inner membrane ring lipoprotein SctJ [Mesorhizobium amorphae]EHH07845.1 Type III secretion bridge between inner and outermembrane lipoprotein (YscJ,HrcJ,EscJ, PscJ) [Mesorhizobium amorphae CCNWGS0123]
MSPMVGATHGEITHSRPPGRLWPCCAVLPLLLALSGCKADLYTKLQEREANDMLALLLNSGVDAVRVAVKDGTSTIQVEEKQLAFSINLLNAKGLPHQSFKNLGEIFKGSGLIASPTEERARYVYALNEELSRTISDIDGVISVRVHVVLPHNDLLREGATPSSASAFIRHDAKANLSILLPQIKMLIANSIEGLSYDKVEVVFVPVERPAFEQRAEPAAVLTQASKSIPAPLLAIAVGFAAAVIGVLSYVLGRARIRQRRQSREPTRLEGRKGVPAIESVAKKMVGDA